jgi:hypothetical protein
MTLILLLLALLGHAVLWVALINRLHSTAIPLAVITGLTLLLAVWAALIPLGFACGMAAGDVAVLGGSSWLRVSWPGAMYVAACWLAGVAIVCDWLRRHVMSRPPAVLRWRRSTRRHLAGPSGKAGSGVEHEHHFLTRLPGNQSLLLDVVEMGLEIARLPPALDGLRITHLSDLHFTGAVGKTYFQEVVRLSNEFTPDLTVVTGDLIDNNDCIDWMPDTLGRLRARYGVYFVLGNHDLWNDANRLRRTLVECGLIYLGGRWLDVELRGERVILAGNELPWGGPAADLQSLPPRSADGRPLVFVLSHSPDQLSWARALDVDLMLAGHTHGGQVRFPWIGPILSPSRVGVKYASGTFHSPPTLMHVSRGLSGNIPLRMNCAPELGLLVLHPPAKS